MVLKIDVLGTKYTLRRVDNGKDDYMEKNNFAGYCNGHSNEIVILNMKTVPEWKDEPEAIIKHKESETIRHELIHAFLNESGLQWDSHSPQAWAKNEEMVDWFAIQMPKLIKAFREADCLES